MTPIPEMFDKGSATATVVENMSSMAMSCGLIICRRVTRILRT
jgi:hypothetical protein